ncbi:hypothetical protein [Amycolatopsis sp. NBC_00438]|uniref:hypothetical protein n=1 Tax=Amycolatopsis sp. NBC_00438 TaxID=2903558 RepID=UPI002E1E3426
MAKIVLLHGIGQEQKSADTLEAEWLPALAGGVRLAGYPDLADRLWRGGTPGDVRMAFYGDVFERREIQGSDDSLDEEELDFAVSLAREWLTRFAESASDPADREAARAELDALIGQAGEPQGARAAARPVINALARVGPFARFGVTMAERTVVKALRQVTRYLTDDDVRERTQARVSEHLGPDTHIVIGHSLGSVVAYEAVHRHERPLALLVTLGSPLGLRTIVYDRTRPQPPHIPAHLARWLNLADRDDLVAARPDLTPWFPGADGVLESRYTVDNGAKPHEATFYLSKPEVGAAVAAVLRPDGQP